MRKTRVNISVDSALLKQAKKKLHLFGGKLSTLFNAYLKDFVETMDKQYSEERHLQTQKIEELEKRIKVLEQHK